MSFNADRRREWEVTGRVWRFAHFEFDETSRELRSGGTLVELESKPLEVLCQLLLHAGEVVTKEELLESAWPGVTVVEGSLATAVSKLRKALGDDEPPIVLTVPRIGYRLAVPVQCKLISAPPARELGFQPGEAVPGRDQWRFVRKLHDSASSEVWLAGTSQNPRVSRLQVCRRRHPPQGPQTRSYPRPAAQGLPRRTARSSSASSNGTSTRPRSTSRASSAAPISPNGRKSQGGLSAIPLATRLRVIIDLAQAVAAAHDVGVLHKDLKPANVLVAPRPDSDFQVKAADFGSGALMEPSRLSALGITNLGFTQTMTAEAGDLTGTLMYLPPEVLAGQSPTALADVYALGVMLYQVVAGDFRKPLSPGWEADVQDPLLREDIAQAACGDPARRLASVAVLLERLQTLDRRRRERGELELTRERARVAEQRLAASRARRPWAVAAAVTLVAGLAVSLFLYGKAARERDRANRQTAITASVNRFLADDLVGRSDPFRSGKSEETLLDAVKQASPDIDRQFHNAPEVAARLHQTIARALDNRSEFPDARREYDRAAALFLQGQGPLSQDAIIVHLQRAAMEARTYQQGSVALARSILAREEPLIARLRAPHPELPVWLATARGMVALIGNDAKTAARQFQTAYDDAVKLPSFDEHARLTLKQRLAFVNIRTGDGVTAERLFRELIAAFSEAGGPDNPNVLRVRLNLAQAFMVEGKNREAVQEANSIYPEYVKRLGADHELTMQLLTTRAQCEGSLGMWEDAIRDDLADLQSRGPQAGIHVVLCHRHAVRCRARPVPRRPLPGGGAKRAQSLRRLHQGVRPARRPDRWVRLHPGELLDRSGQTRPNPRGSCGVSIRA